VHAPAIAIDLMVDPIGAGDGFAAGFLSAHLEGLGPRQCLERGHAIGAMVCQTRGDWEGLPTRAQLDTFVSGRKESNR
jgi:2-dehydro-3-deoxygluconokinase